VPSVPASSGLVLSGTGRSKHPLARTLHSFPDTMRFWAPDDHAVSRSTPVRLSALGFRFSAGGLSAVARGVRREEILYRQTGPLKGGGVEPGHRESFRILTTP
jgi:hypothetical protein